MGERLNKLRYTYVIDYSAIKKNKLLTQVIIWELCWAKKVNPKGYILHDPTYKEFWSDKVLEMKNWLVDVRG